MTLEEALEKSGTANLVDDKTLQATKELIEPNEEILYALYTKYAFMSIFETVTTNLMLNQDGIVIVTNNRMICFKKQKRAIDDIIEMRIIEIKNIGQMGNLMADVGYLHIFSDIYRWRIYASNKEQIDGIKSAIKTAQNMIKEQ